MENDELNKRIQELINYLIEHRKVTGYFPTGKGEAEWNELIAAMREQNLIESGHSKGSWILTPKGESFKGNKYIEKVQRDTLLGQKVEERQKKEFEKFEIDLKQVKRQAKVFWPGFAIAVLGGLLGLATFIVKMVEKPKTETKYIGVDSKGHVIEFTIKKD